VKRGVWAAGGFPLEFPVISLGEPFMKRTTLQTQNCSRLSEIRRVGYAIVVLESLKLLTSIVIKPTLGVIDKSRHNGDRS